MAFNILEVTAYCSMPCKRKVEKDQNREWLREYYRRLREEHHMACSVYKPRETIEEVVAKANAAGLSYGKYVALQREKEGCVDLCMKEM